MNFFTNFLLIVTMVAMFDGEWGYLYRAVDSHGDTLDFMLSERRDEEAATAFFKQAINNNGFPDKVRKSYWK
jgi:transposase-like protein